MSRRRVRLAASMTIGVGMGITGCAALVDLHEIDYVPWSDAHDGQVASDGGPTVDAPFDVEIAVADADADVERDAWAPCNGEVVSSFPTGFTLKQSPLSIATPGTPTPTAIHFEASNAGDYVYYERTLDNLDPHYCIRLEFRVGYTEVPAGTIDGPTIRKVSETEDLSFAFELSPSGRYSLGDAINASLANPLALGTDHDLVLVLDRGATAPNVVDYAVELDGVRTSGVVSGDLGTALAVRIGITAANGPGRASFDNVRLVFGTR